MFITRTVIWSRKLLGANATQFYWDYENRLKQVILPNGQNVVYKYDALGTTEVKEM